MSTKIPLLTLTATLTVGCLDRFLKSADEEDEKENEKTDSEPQEGEQQGDCLDGEDNDDDGYIDCEDSGCDGKPACEGAVDTGIADTGEPEDTQDTQDTQDIDTGSDTEEADQADGYWSLLSSTEDCRVDTSTYYGQTYTYSSCYQVSTFNMSVVGGNIISSEVIVDETFSYTSQNYNETYANTYECTASNLSGSGAEYYIDVGVKQLDCSLSSVQLSCTGNWRTDVALQFTLTR